MSIFIKMKVKELRKQLKGEYTEIIPFHTEKRNVIPFTQLPREFLGLKGKKFDRVLDEKEVVEYKLGERKRTACWTSEELIEGVGHYKMTRYLTIYFK